MDGLAGTADGGSPTGFLYHDTGGPVTGGWPGQTAALREIARPGDSARASGAHLGKRRIHMRNPTYYVAIFGNPDLPNKDFVESGRYHLGIRGTTIPGERGDIMLLYCTEGYPGHLMSVPGIGVVLTKTSDSIFYRYLPFVKPITRNDIDMHFMDEDKKKFSGIGCNSCWLFEISRNSFCAAIENSSIEWP